MSSIDLRVSYGLCECMSFVRDFGAWHQATEGGKTELQSSTRSPLARFVHTATLYLIAPPIFVVKKHAVGNCEFSIDEHRIVRRSKSADVALLWRDVVRVHRLTRAYLVQKEQGALPLPYRAFTALQIQQFESILEQNAISILEAQ